ncbi:hypothetical protein [Deinococcus sp. Marseille-Q6407]|uniref:hypothetical protein n=1 Tax=Deinococcus sp. Marseille-Q6407 TaxID=2969223 RepID=UPI0021C1053C|nr:hypothetical protein [Deinococcus sp. Marseille-Q6407]
MSEYKVTIHKTGEVITGIEDSDTPGWLISKIHLAADALEERGIESDVTVELDGTETFTAAEVREFQVHIRTVRKNADTPEQQRMYENEDLYGQEVSEMDNKSKALNN